MSFDSDGKMCDLEENCERIKSCNIADCNLLDSNQNCQKVSLETPESAKNEKGPQEESPCNEKFEDKNKRVPILSCQPQKVYQNDVKHTIEIDKSRNKSLKELSNFKKIVLPRRNLGTGQKHSKELW